MKHPIHILAEICVYACRSPVKSIIKICIAE